MIPSEPTRSKITAVSGHRFLVRVAILAAIALALSFRLPAQTAQKTDAHLGRAMGTVLDVNGGPVTGASVALSGPDLADRRTAATGENGFFEFDDVRPGIPIQVTVTADGFADWTSPEITLGPGEFKLLGEITLALATQNTTVVVNADPVEAATEEFKESESQRVFGIIPNFYVAYDVNAAPLTPKLKFELALRVSVDPATIAGIALLSGLKQAADTPNYGQGAVGYGKRFGATTADGFTDIMIGGAILPSLLRQDPRYFYKGTGSTRSRLRHALLGPFVARGDNGEYQPNFSTVGGDLASAGLANLYYPKSNRGPQLLLGNFAIGTIERIGSDLAQEFVLSRLTHRGGHFQ